MSNYELTGIENDNGNDYYVLKLIDGENVSYDYYNTTSYLKEKSISIQKVLPIMCWQALLNQKYTDLPADIETSFWHR